MNVIQMRQEKRSNQISDIRNSIKKAMENNSELDFKSIVMSVCSNLGLSQRTAQEYANVALYQLGIKKEDLWKPKKI